ncbi:coiled-coil domain-containing protein 174-like isoform X2 [Crassostrea virginica]
MEEKQNSSSLIDLKAELFRKQEEFKKQKLQNQNASVIRGKTIEKKATIWSKKNKGVSDRNSKDLEQKIEEANDFEKSRKCLEAKAKLYEKITHGGDIPEEDGSQVYLVDFQKKAIDKIVEDRDRRRKEEEEERERKEEELLSKAVVPPPANEDEEWVDYVDGFGRSRRCMKKDLPQLIQQDKKVHKDNSDIPADKRSAELVSNDMYREMLRQKWEEEEEAAMNQPIHYSNVQYDEIRTHGVGFYQFAKDEESRKEQLEALKDMRDKTKDERSRREKIKEKRKAIMEARLAKVKQRKMKREGITELPEEQGDEDDIGPKLSEAAQEVNSEEREPDKKEPKEPVLLTRDENLRSHSTQREWDKGKEKLFPLSNEQRYFESRREERISEFAPPSMYYDNKNSQQKETKGSITSNKISEKQIQDFLSQERMNIQKTPGVKSEVMSLFKSEATSCDGVQSGFESLPSDIKSERIQDIPLPDSADNSYSSNTIRNNQMENVHQKLPHYPPSNLPSQLGPFYVPTHLPPPGYVQPSYPPMQQWPQQPPPFMHYPTPTVSSGYLSTPMEGYSVQTTTYGNQSTESIGSQQATTVSRAANSPAVDVNVQPSTKPTRFNIVDPRLIQNEEVLETTPQNFTPLLEKTTENPQ